MVKAGLSARPGLDCGMRLVKATKLREGGGQLKIC